MSEVTNNLNLLHNLKEKLNKLENNQDATEIIESLIKILQNQRKEFQDFTNQIKEEFQKTMITTQNSFQLIKEQIKDLFDLMKTK